MCDDPLCEGGGYGDGCSCPLVIYKGTEYPVDRDGFLQDPEKWTMDFAHHVKEQEGIAELTEEHWKVIHYLQDYYKKNGIAPMIRVMTKAVGYKLNLIKKLFPGGAAKVACRMAGLPKSTGCV